LVSTDSSPHVLRAIVRSWPLREQIAFFEDDVALPLVEETESAKLFPASQSARDARDRLLAVARRRGVTLLTNTVVTGFAPSTTGWQIDRQDAEALHADAVIVATGGLSVPNTGSDGGGLRIGRLAQDAPLSDDRPVFAVGVGGPRDPR
jgi:predicted flavoprotein YhiN